MRGLKPTLRLPSFALADALHIAIATINKARIIASYNFRHISGVSARQKIELALTQLGYQSPVIATPEIIMENL